MFSIVIPVYGNEASIPPLLEALARIAGDVHARNAQTLEVVFVVDGSPDRSFDVLASLLPAARFRSKLLLHSRNFGAFAAIRTGLAAATGDYFAVMAADLQEPPELMTRFLDALSPGLLDIVVGCRQSRQDPWASRMASMFFWRLYRALVVRDMPSMGVDIFACNRVFRDHLLRLEEANSSLVGQIFWLGFRRGEIHYERRLREHGKSAWTFRKKARYLFDSVFSFTDLPVRMLSAFGLLGVVASIALGLVVLVMKIQGGIPVPGYAATMLTVMFFGGINALGLGIVGSYAWRAYENTKARPLSLTIVEESFVGAPTADVHVAATGSVR
jgi:glycosyltransferase involved in cell wall biosynthesis